MVRQARGAADPPLLLLCETVDLSIPHALLQQLAAGTEWGSIR